MLSGNLAPFVKKIDISSTSSLMVLDLRQKVGGKRFHECHPEDHSVLLLEDVKNALINIASAERWVLEAVQVLDLSCNFIANEDLRTVVEMLDLLPTVYELELSACSLNSSKAKDIQMLTRRNAIKRVYLQDNVIASFSGRELFDGLDVEDVEKVIFINDPEFLESKAWTNMVRKSELHKAVLFTHREFFKEYNEALSQIQLPVASKST